ncbi:MAG: molybdenum cofactor guanylyltransferase [Chloroflexi bacterium]|nr:molybdenum cofactor guanylyltransferase [Chloroflexota bacterium]
MDGSTGVTGVILAGGRSRRLGRDKRLEPFAGETLFARVAKRLGEVCDEIVAVAADEDSRAALPNVEAVRVVNDVYPDRGSLGGIYSGLAAATNTWSIVVATDMPFLNVRLLTHLLSLREGYDAVVPMVEGFPEPTHAAYAKTCLKPIEARIQRNDLKIAKFFEDVHVRFVEEAELRRFDPDLDSFFNVNTPEDLERAQSLARQGR